MVSARHPMVTGTTSELVAVDELSALQRWMSAARPNASKASDLSPGVHASLLASIAALRWGAAMIGLAWTINLATDGDLTSVLTLSVAIFVTSWRTIVPIRFGEPGPLPILKALGDVAALALALGLSGGLSSAFVGTLLIAVAVASFGWGVGTGVFSGLGSLALVGLGGALSQVIPNAVAGGTAGNPGFVVPSPLAVSALAAVAILPGIAMDRLSEIESRRRALAAQRDRLAEANELLEMLGDLARTLPSSLDLNDVVAATRDQMRDTFGADRLAIVSFEEGYWSPQYQNGFDLPPQLVTGELPPPLDAAVVASDVLLIEDLSLEHGRPGSGLYTRLVVSGVDIGVLAIEHRLPNQYSWTDIELLRSMSDVLALTLANARSFRRLRSLAAAEERTRIARDLHDRLGQYLTYIAFELERINGEREEPSPDLKKLHEEVQGAIAEFRDTLIELRASVTPERPLALVLGEVVDRFRRRSQIEVELEVPPASERLPAIIENELLRIAQEALSNIQKHAHATHVRMAWVIAEGRGMLVIEDDGRGFDPAKGIRGSAYGLVGMRERAASVGALLEISTAPGQGTTIIVQTSQTSEQVKKP